MLMGLLRCSLRKSVMEAEWMLWGGAKLLEREFYKQ